MTSLSIADARYELKFVGDAEAQGHLDRWLRKHPLGLARAYAPRWVDNLYFDSHGLHAYQQNLTGVSARSKLRLRWYGTTLEPRAATLERKIRRNRLGWKVAHPVTDLPSFARSSWREVVRSIRQQLPPEERLIFDQIGEPVIMTRYFREYLVSRNGRVRVTVDTDHSALEQRQRSRPNLSRWARVPSPLVLEVKFDSGRIDDGRAAVRDIPLRVSRHSKYVVNVGSTL